MGALSLLPLWGFMYVRSVTDQADAASGPLGDGAEVYGSCASCHGATGGGGVGYPFANGEVLATFPHIEDQLRFVYFGTALYNIAGVADYGNPDREGGPHLTGAHGPMPAWGEDANGELTDPELLAVVCHERYTLGGADETAAYAAEFEKWCAEDSEIFAGLEAGDFTLPTLARIGRGHHPDRHRAGARFSSRRRVTAPDPSAGNGARPGPYAAPDSSTRSSSVPAPPVPRPRSGSPRPAIASRSSNGGRCHA